MVYHVQRAPHNAKLIDFKGSHFYNMAREEINAKQNSPRGSRAGKKGVAVPPGVSSAPAVAAPPATGSAPNDTAPTSVDRAAQAEVVAAPSPSASSLGQDFVWKVLPCS